MPIRNLFSNRIDRNKGVGKPDAYIFDRLPQELRVQIVYIWDDAIGQYQDQYFSEPSKDKAWRIIHNSVAREHAVFRLAEGSTARDSCVNFLFRSDVPIEKLLDLIEFSFVCIEQVANLSDGARQEFGKITPAPEAIKELNGRFKNARLGYRFEGSRIKRVDSEHIDTDIVTPALNLLNDVSFTGPNEEFLQAHTHYRNGNNKEAILNANKAFESTLKTICDNRKWDYPKGAPATQLIKVVKNQGLFPDYLDNSFTQLVSTLNSGLPEIRNQEGAHGQGKTPRNTPDYVAAYAIHLAAVNILFLVEAYKAKEYS